MESTVPSIDDTSKEGSRLMESEAGAGVTSAAEASATTVVVDSPVADATLSILPAAPATSGTTVGDSRDSAASVAESADCALTRPAPMGLWPSGNAGGDGKGEVAVLLSGTGDCICPAALMAAIEARSSSI